MLKISVISNKYKVNYTSASKKRLIQNLYILTKK